VLLTTDPHYGTQYVRERSWRFDVIFCFTLKAELQVFFSFHSSGGSRVVPCAL